MTEHVTITRAEYDRLLEVEEDLADLIAGERVKAAIAGGEDELVPAELVKRLLDGESPLRAWRGHRGLTQQQLAEASGVNRVQIADIEARRSAGSIETVKKLAAALGLSIDDLV